MLFRSRHVLIARVEARRTRPRHGRHILTHAKQRQENKEDELILTKRESIEEFPNTRAKPMCPGAHEHMPMEANNPTESNDYATPTNPCHVPTTENRSGQIETSRGQIRADRDNPPLSLGALSSSLTSTCKSRCLHPNLTHTRLNLHGAQHSRNH